MSNSQQKKHETGKETGKRDLIHQRTQSIESNSEWAQILDFVEKYFTAVTIVSKE